MDQDRKKRIAAALGRIPQSVYILTSHFEERMRGVMVSWVQQVAFQPPMIMVALAKGRPIVPLLHDSHSFAVCQIPRSDKVVMRRFARVSDPGDDLFQGLTYRRGVTGSPILTHCLSYFDCELIRHIDVDGDHDLYVGAIHDGGVCDHLGDEEIIVRFRESGFTY